MTDHHQILNLTCTRKKKASVNGNLLDIEEGYQLKICKSIIEVANIWYKVAPEDDIFFSIPYLSLLEEYPLSRSKMRYGIIHQNGKPIAAMVCQIQDFKLVESLKEPLPGLNVIGIFSNWFRGKVAKKIKFDSMVCGNLSLTGEYGFHFVDKELSYKRQFELVEKSMNAISEFTKLVDNIDISVMMIKDFYENKKFDNHEIKNSSFTEFSVQPNMIMKIDENWSSFDDYLSSLTSKYRVRVRRAFKKADKIERKLLTWMEIQQYEEKIYELYSEITDKAEFNIVKLHPKYFTELKKELPRKVKLFGYFLGERLIAFNSVILNGDELEAHFLGYDQSYNREYQLYLNMLYDIVSEAIELKVKHVIFARTALEIKSSVGAVPSNMFLYLKHRNSFNNRFVPRLLKYLSPKEEWIPRSPFKEKEQVPDSQTIKS